MACTILCCLTFKLTNLATVITRQSPDIVNLPREIYAAAESWDADGKRQLKSNARDFVFKRDCLLCGQVCVPKDHKNPHRWVRVNQCRTVDRGDGVLTFREQLEYTCKERGDGWSSEV